MGDDLSPTKKRLREYLEKRGVAYNKAKKTWRCPKHSDDDPSATLYDNQETPYLYCPVCSENFSIFDVAGLLDGTNDFTKMIESVNQTLGNVMPEKKSSAPKEKKKSEPISIDQERVKEVYKKEVITKLGIEKKWGSFVFAWGYTDKDNKIIAVDVRFEDEKKKKDVITFFYDGSLKWFGAPIIIYNLYSALQSEKPLLIVEGAKCVDIAAALSEFTPVSWNGGAGKAHLVDWSVFSSREIFILPDNDDPGLKAAHKIKEQLPQSKIVKSPTNGKGDDIEQFLEKMSPDALTAYILNTENHIDDSRECPTEPDFLGDSPPPDGNQDVGHSSEPFKILGVGDDGRGNFIDWQGRHQCEKLTSINASFLKVLAPLEHWKFNFPKKYGIDWEEASSLVIEGCQQRSFDRNIFRGRGAWRDDKLISYHNGVKTIGDHSDDKIYMKLTPNNVVIDAQIPDRETMIETKELIFKISFETPADAVRCMGWSVIAPFCGALKFRPAILLTGESGSGKTTVATMMIKRLTKCFLLNGSETTVAGIRGLIKRDSCPIVFDETEADSEKKKLNRDELLSLMRANTSDDAPDTIKGTKDGGYVSYKMQNIFAFIGINPTVESAADENRIFRINMIPSKKQRDWKKIESQLKIYLDETHCDAIRSLTWTKLKIIMDLAERIVGIIQDKTHRDYRSSYADALMASAFMVVWTYCDDPTDEQIGEMLDKYYQFQPVESHRNESEETVDRLMDEVIEVIHEHNGREKRSIREILNSLYIGEVEDPEQVRVLTVKEKAAYRQAVGRYGVKLTEEGNVAISNDNHMIKKILNVGTGYGKILKRHPDLIETSRNVSFPDKKQRRCTIINGIIKKKYEDMTDDEKLEATL